jgi:uncharacterized protein YcfJ
LRQRKLGGPGKGGFGASCAVQTRSASIRLSLEERIMRKAFFAATAVAAALVSAQPAAAQQYRSYQDEHVATYEQCQRSRNNRTAGGAVIGGVLGAVLGSNVANSRSNRDEGRVLGAVVGAVAGGAIGRSTARCDGVQGSYDPYYGEPDRRYAQDDEYYRDDDLYGGPYEDEYYEDDYYGDDRY